MRKEFAVNYDGCLSVVEMEAGRASERYFVTMVAGESIYTHKLKLLK